MPHRDAIDGALVSPRAAVIVNSPPANMGKGGNQVGVLPKEDNFCPFGARNVNERRRAGGDLVQPERLIQVLALHQIVMLVKCPQRPERTEAGFRRPGRAKLRSSTRLTGSSSEA